MKINIPALITGGLVGITACTGAALTSSTIYADNDSAVDQITITVPTACTMSGSVATGQEHSAELTPGTYSGATGSTYENGIGKTTLTTYCNDNNGFSIYAIGFTSNTEGDNTLVGTSASGNATIATKVYEQSDTQSNWSMKVTKVTDTTQTYNPNNMTVTNSFNTWHTVPDDYTKVAEYKSTTEPATTDTTLGAKLETTYATYISTTQPADTYTGKVKYVMVHPYDAAAPVIEVPGVYTLSRADAGESATQIGEPVPNDTATYDSPAEVMNAWEEIWGEGIYPFYLKHTVVNDIIAESYLGFTISPELVADNNEGMIPGDYALRGGVDESSLQDKPIFTANVNLLKRVYDYANHPERCEGDSDYFSCHASNSSYLDPAPTAYSTGEVNSSNGMHCNVEGNGWSGCEWQ